MKKKVEENVGIYNPKLHEMANSKLTEYLGFKIAFIAFAYKAKT